MTSFAREVSDSVCRRLEPFRQDTEDPQHLQFDDMTEEFRNEMMKRIQKGICSDEGSILFAEMITDFERIGDHATNIAEWVEFSVTGVHKGG